MNGLHSEDQFLELIDECFPGSHPHLLLGRGDDAAVLHCPEQMCLATDLFLEDQHFRRGYFEPEDVGWKGLAVNLSDLAAMGARPLGFCLGLMAPADVPADYWRRLFQGMASLARQYDCPLAGGDLSRSDKIGLSITVWGGGWSDDESEPTPRFLTRSGARPGDALFAVLPSGGGLGLARAGLLALEKALAAGDPAEVASAKRRYPAAAAAHLRPEPLLESGRILARNQAVTACMDLSDGLARDLPRLLVLGADGPVGARLEIDPAAAHPELLAVARDLALDPLETLILGGEDYGLLAVGKSLRQVQDVPNLFPLGEITAAPGVSVNGREWVRPGFDHFGK